LANKAIKFGEKTQNKDYHAVQGHSRSSRSVSIESRVCDFLLVINTDIQTRTVSELSQLIVQILDTAFFEPPFERLGATYDIYIKLI